MSQEPSDCWSILWSSWYDSASKVLKVSDVVYLYICWTSESKWMTSLIFWKHTIKHFSFFGFWNAKDKIKNAKEYLWGENDTIKKNSPTTNGFESLMDYPHLIHHKVVERTRLFLLPQLTWSISFYPFASLSFNSLPLCPTQDPPSYKKTHIIFDCTFLDSK